MLVQRHGVRLKVVLTGGPCGGKTTAMSRLSDTFSNMGWKVYRASELASFVLRGGVNFASLSDTHVNAFQKGLLETMLNLEKVYEALADAESEAGKNCILLCDRGAMDISAYMKQEDWDEMLEKIGWTETAIRDQRYDCVIHMVTAAIGAEQHYNFESNNIRTEQADQARMIDRKLMSAWMGHPSYILIDNACPMTGHVIGFDEKLDRVIQAVLGFAGLQDIRSVRGAQRRKFLVDCNDAEIGWPSGLCLNKFNVSHVMLHPSADATTFYRLRKRSSSDGITTYTLASTTINYDGSRIETRRNVDTREYEALMKQADPEYLTVEKTRYCFIWNDRYYQLDLYWGDLEPFKILEAYIPETQSVSELPPFLVGCIEEEVTNNPSYKITNLARV